MIIPIKGLNIRSGRCECICGLKVLTPFLSFVQQEVVQRSSIRTSRTLTTKAVLCPCSHTQFHLSLFLSDLSSITVLPGRAIHHTKHSPNLLSVAILPGPRTYQTRHTFLLDEVMSSPQDICTLTVPSSPHRPNIPRAVTAPQLAAALEKEFEPDGTEKKMQAQFGAERRCSSTSTDTDKLNDLGQESTHGDVRLLPPSYIDHTNQTDHFTHRALPLEDRAGSTPSIPPTFRRHRHGKHTFFKKSPVTPISKRSSSS